MNNERSNNEEKKPSSISKNQPSPKELVDRIRNLPRSYVGDSAPPSTTKPDNTAGDTGKKGR